MNSVDLSAGPLQMIFEPSAGMLRHVRYEGEEIVRGVYAAVRNQNWGTVEPKIKILSQEISSSKFALSFECACKDHDVDFSWKGKITGKETGNVEFEFCGKANKAFKSNRIGFCVLHPAECAGKSCQITHTDGSLTKGEFPLMISPHQPYFNIRAIEHEVANQALAVVEMEGDTFEMEDQRNWTDASYKTYCTPLHLPYPVTVAKGQTFEQKITISIHGASKHSSRQASEENGYIELELEDKQSLLPPLGLQASEAAFRPLSPDSLEAIKDLALSHLRADIKLHASDWKRAWESSVDEANALNLPLEVAVFIDDDAKNQLGSLKQLMSHTFPDAGIKRWLLFHKDEMATQAKWITLFRNALADHLNETAVISGSNAYFTELNRNRPDSREIDGVCYSVNPQVHAFDDASLMETLSMQGVCIDCARAFSKLPVHVSPVTLKMRWNPDATGPETANVAGEPPSHFDPRYNTPFAACWTLGSLKYQAQSQAASLTYFSTYGWSGVLSQTGKTRPLYALLKAVGAYHGGCIIHSRSSQPQAVEILHLGKKGKRAILIANMQAKPNTVKLSRHCLGEASKLSRMHESGWSEAENLERDNPYIELSAHAIAMITYPESQSGAAI